MTHTNYNTGEPCDCDRPDNKPAHAIDSEIRDLFTDLDHAQRRAINGRWSMECDWIVERIAMLVEVGGLLPNPDDVAISPHLFAYAVAQLPRYQSEKGNE